jgi:Fic family protein
MNKNILEGLRSALLSRGSFDTFPEKVWTTAASLNTYGTNSIEGNTLTQDEVDTVLIDREGVKKPIRFIMETIQHEAAFKHLVGRRARAIDLVSILEMHEEVFKGILQDYGQWRNINVTIRGASFTPPRPEKIVPKMDGLIKEYNQRQLLGEDVFALGAWLHYNFESIHPFSDGNGRVGRLLLNLHFLKHNWPPVNVMPADRVRYLEALSQGALGNLEPMTEYLKVIMGASLLNFLSFVGTEIDELNPLLEYENEITYSPKYLSLRARQGELAAVMIKNEWHTSKRALQLYTEEVGRT